MIFRWLSCIFIQTIFDIYIEYLWIWIYFVHVYSSDLYDLEFSYNIFIISINVCWACDFTDKNRLQFDLRQCLMSMVWPVKSRSSWSCESYRNVYLWMLHSSINGGRPQFLRCFKDFLCRYFIYLMFILIGAYVQTNCVFVDEMHHSFWDVSIGSSG